MFWSVHLNGGPQRVNHAAVIVGDKVYSFGGYCSGQNYRVRRPIDVHILNTVNLRWEVFYPRISSSQKVPYLRYGHTAVAHGTKVYIWGGRNYEAACNSLFCFNTERFEWSCIKTSGTTPGARDGHSACIIADHMYIFGGFEDDQDQYCQDVYKLNLHTFCWTYLITEGMPPSHRDFHSATAIDNRMFVFGGRGDQTAPLYSQDELYCNNILYLDVKDQKWHTPVTTGEIPTGRRSHSAFVYDGQIYVFGGYNSVKNVHFNDLHRFNPDTNCWQQVHPLGEPPSRRRRQSCVVSGTRMFLFGGSSPVQNENEEVDSHDPEDMESKLKDHDDLHILDFEPSLRTLCLAAVIHYQLDDTSLPEELKLELTTIKKNNRGIPKRPTTA